MLAATGCLLRRIECGREHTYALVCRSHSSRKIAFWKGARHQRGRPRALGECTFADYVWSANAHIPFRLRLHPTNHHIRGAYAHGRTWPLPRAPVELWFGCTRLIGLVCHGESVRRTRPDRVQCHQAKERRRRPRECVPVGQKLSLRTYWGGRPFEPIQLREKDGVQNFGKTKKTLSVL